MKLEHTTALDANCEIRRMTGEELLSVHAQNPDKTLIKQLGLTTNSPQLDKFCQSVFHFYRTTAQKLQGYFQKGLTCIKLDYMQVFAPTNHCKLETKIQIEY